MLWYTLGVFRWRTAACTAWLVLLAIPSLAAFQLLCSFTPFHPIAWITGWIRGGISLRTLMLVCLYLVLMVVASVINSLTYTVKLPIYKTRLHTLWSVLDPSHLLVVGAYLCLGAGGGYCLAEMAGYRWLWESCEGYQRCLNEYQLFFAFHGAFMGACYGGNYFLNKEHFLAFPSIQQQKLFRLRGHVGSHLAEGLVFTAKGLLLYYPLYYILGWHPRGQLVEQFSLHLRDTSPPLTSLRGLLDVGLLLHVLLVGTLLHSSWTFGLRMFRVFHTEMVRFPVIATFSGEASRLLTAAMESTSTPLLKYLGYLDLYQLSIHSETRRKHVYSLNQSGQPAVWGTISNGCVSLIKELTTKLGGKIPPEGTTNVPLAPLTQPSSLTNGGSSSPPVTTKGWSDPAPSIFSPPGITRRTALMEKARLWSYSSGVQGVPTPPKPIPTTEPIPLAGKLQEVRSSVNALPQKVMERLKKKPFFAFFLEEFPDAASQTMFAESRLHVWAITGITQLAVASYTEDSYGVVQKSLPDILNALISLSQALDKHVKISLSKSQSTRNVRLALERNGKFAIKTAVHTALNQLGTSFRKERRSLHLSEEQLQYWDSLIGIRTL